MGKNHPLYKGKISIREGEFEKAVSVFAEIGRKIDFSKSQNIAIAYRPNEKTVISFFEAEQFQEGDLRTEEKQQIPQTEEELLLAIKFLIYFAVATTACKSKMQADVGLDVAFRKTGDYMRNEISDFLSLHGRGKTDLE